MKNTLLAPAKVSKPKVKNQVKVQLREEKQVIVHCSIPGTFGLRTRIWKTTYLITEDKKKIPLVFWEGITLFPEWTRVDRVGIFRFTLIFSGLPNDCQVFSMVEEIPEPGGFLVSNISRNKKDVYSISL